MGGEALLALFHGSMAARAIALQLPPGSGASPAAGSQADNRLVEN